MNKTRFRTVLLALSLSVSCYAEDLELQVRLHEFASEDSPFLAPPPQAVRMTKGTGPPPQPLGVAALVPRIGGPPLEFEPGTIILTQRIRLHEGQKLEESILTGEPFTFDGDGESHQVGEITLDLVLDLGPTKGQTVHAAVKVALRCVVGTQDGHPLLAATSVNFEVHLPLGQEALFSPCLAGGTVVSVGLKLTTSQEPGP